MSAKQGSAAWLAERAGKVTASRIADVIARTKSGPSASRAAYMGELAAERLTGTPAESFTNADMQRGTELEPLARVAYESASGHFVEECGFVAHPKIAMSGASPDGLIASDGLLEIKCPRTHTHIEYLIGREPPAKYVPQMAWQAACTGRAWVEFVSFDPRMPEELRLFVARYEPTPAYIAELESAVREFIEELDAKVETLRQLGRAA